MTTAAPRRSQRPFVRRLLLGLAAGVITGLFFGEWTRVLEPMADGFVRLLQMAVLPYVTVSLIASIGSLRLDDIRTLGIRGGLVLLGLWTLALAAAFLMPLVFPPAVTGAFFSTTLVQRAPPLDLVDLYIPANPFHALANSIVPAVVLFSIAVGVALIGVPRKQPLLDVLDAGRETLARVMRFVTSLTPYGLFAIAATVAGTIRLDQAGRLNLYLAAYAALALLLALWVLPGLVSALTPIPVRAILASNRDALVTATIAGDLFIVLPLLVASCKELTARFGAAERHAAALPDVIVPMSFNFPHSGKLLSVSFVLFAAWFADAPIAAADYPRLALTSVVTLFGGVTAAMPFLLDLFHVPGDTFQLFVASGVINSRFGSLVAAMHTVAMALLGTCAVAGMIRWQPRQLVRYAVITTALTVTVLGGVRALAGDLSGPQAAGDRLDAMRIDLRSESVLRPDVSLAADTAPVGTRLDSIGAHRVLRVAFLPDALPFAFVNGRNELVGFDIALMHHLARELGARLEFTPIGREGRDPLDTAAVLLRSGASDIVVGGLAVTTARAQRLQLSDTYLSETLGFVVRDHDRQQFASWDAIRRRGRLTIAVPAVPYYVDKLRRQVPEAQLVMVDRIAELFGPPAAAADAIALPAERGSVWTLKYPQYAVVVPSPAPLQIPLAFALPHDEAALFTFVNTWIDLKRRDGTLDALYKYWILGEDPVPPHPRWSIMRDVLRWTVPSAPAPPDAGSPP